MLVSSFLSRISVTARCVSVKMKNLCIIIMLLVFCSFSVYSQEMDFTLEGYKERWFEIVRFKNPFKKKRVKNVTAESQV